MNMLESANVAPAPRPRVEKPQFSDILRQVAITALRRWWMVSIPVGIVLAALAMAVVFVIVEPLYRATALIQIKSYQPRIVFDKVLDDSYAFVNTQRELMRNRVVLEKVVSQPEIASLPELRIRRDPVTYLAGKVSINSISSSELYEIGFEGPNPVNGAKVVNAIVDEFLEFHQDVETQGMERVIELLQTEHDYHSQNVAGLRDRVRELSKSLTGEDPFAAPRIRDDDAAAQGRLAYLESELTKNAVEQAMHRSRITALKELASRYPVEVPETTINAAMADHEEVQKLMAAISQKRKLRQEVLLTSALREQDPVYLEISRQINRQTEILKRAKERIAKEARSHSASQYETELRQLEAALKTAQAMEEALTKQYNQEMSQSQRVTGDTLELEFKRAELERAENVHAMIASRIVQLETEHRAPARIELLAYADPPKTPVEAVPYKKMVVAGGAAFCLPLLLSIGFEYRSRRVSDIDQWKVHSTLPVLAEIAKIPSHSAFRSEVCSGVPRRLEVGFFEEAIHGLRTRLMLSGSLPHLQVLAVTSAVSGEGKTSVASQLACSFARSANKKVLLIDGDMRAPDLHKLFDVNRDPGLADLLQDAEPPAAIKTVMGDTFHLLSAGRPASDTHALVSTPAMKKLIAQAREKYDIVIIDTPPVLAAHEALILAKAADAVVLCVMRDHSRLVQVATAYDKLMGAGIQPIGAVFSGVTKRKYAYSYGKYYGQYESSAK